MLHGFVKLQIVLISISNLSLPLLFLHNAGYVDLNDAFSSDLNGKAEVKEEISTTKSEGKKGTLLICDRY